MVRLGALPDARRSQTHAGTCTLTQANVLSLMASIKMAERSEEWHSNPSSENNSSKTAIATVRENSKIKIKASKIER